MCRKHSDALPATRRPRAGTLHLLRRPEVCARIAMSNTELYRRIAAGEFPAPVKLGRRASGWLAHEVDDWIAARIAARDEGGAQ